MQSEFEKYVDQLPDPAPPEIEMKDLVCNNPLQAQLLIIAVNGLLVADVAYIKIVKFCMILTLG